MRALVGWGNSEADAGEVPAVLLRDGLHVINLADEFKALPKDIHHAWRRGKERLVAKQPVTYLAHKGKMTSAARRRRMRTSVSFSPKTSVCAWLS